MPKSPEQFNMYSEKKALDEAQRMQEKISKGEAIDYNEAEMQIEQEETFPEQFKFDTKTKSMSIGFDRKSVNVWVEVEAENTFFKDRKDELIRQSTFSLARIYKIFGDEGLKKFLKFNRIKLKELAGKKLYDNFLGLKEKINEKKFPDDILHPEFTLPDDILHESCAGRNKIDMNKIIGFEIEGYFYELGQKEVSEIEENYSGGNSLQGESSTFYRVKRNRPCWHKRELNKEETLQDLNMPGIGTISGVKFEKRIIEDGVEPKKEQAISEMIDEFDLKIVREIIDFEKRGGKNSCKWYYNGISEDEILSSRKSGERVSSLEKKIEDLLKSRLFKFLQDNLGDKKLENFDVKSQEDIKLSVEANSESNPRYFSIEIRSIGKIGFYLSLFRISGDFYEGGKDREDVQKEEGQFEVIKKISSFCLEEMITDRPEIIKPKFDKVLGVQEHQGRIGFKPSFEDDIVFYDLDDPKLSKALAPGQEYQVVFVGEKKPMMDFNKKEQRKDKRGALMFRQKVKLVL